MTTANRIGVRSGTNSSRGVLAVRANRRRVSVANAANRLPRGRGIVIGGAVSVAAIGNSSLLGSGGCVEPRSGESEVHVVEGWSPRGDGLGREAEPVDEGDRV